MDGNGSREPTQRVIRGREEGSLRPTVSHLLFSKSFDPSRVLFGELAGPVTPLRPPPPTPPLHHPPRSTLLVFSPFLGLLT